MRTIRAMLLAAIALLWTASPLFAQDLRYETETDIEFGGPLGVMMRLMPGGGATREITTVKGSRMRIDSGEDYSFIQDLGAGRLTNLDHDARTYTTFGFEDITAMVQQMSTDMQAGTQNATYAGRDSTGAEATVDIRVTTEPTNERRNIQGLDARRVFLTIEFEGEVMVPQDQGGTGEMEEAGTVVLFTDMWMADQFPEVQAMAEAQREQAQELAEAGRGAGAAMGQLLAANPNLKVAMEEQAEELQGLDGIAVETATYLVGVPPGKRFDRAKALAFANESLGSQAARGARNAAVDGARSAISGALGRFGRRNNDPEPAPEPRPEDMEQGVLFRVRNRITEVERGSFSESLFEIPSGYREQPLEPMP
jgi:hypothetical protein